MEIRQNPVKEMKSIQTHYEKAKHGHKPFACDDPLVTRANVEGQPSSSMQFKVNKLPPTHRKSD